MNTTRMPTMNPNPHPNKSLCNDPTRKAWVVEMHAPDGDAASHDFAVFTLNQAIVDVIAARSELLKEQAHKQAELPGPLLDCDVNFTADGADAIFLEVFHFWRLQFNPGDQFEDAVLSFMCLNEEGTTGIYVKDFLARFAAQTPDQVVVFAREECYGRLADAVEIALERASTIQDERILTAADAQLVILADNEPAPYNPHRMRPS